MESKNPKLGTQKGQNVLNMTNEQAFAYLEGLLWPDGAFCRHCGSTNVYRMQGKTCRAGLHRCRDCKKQFTVTVGTIFEDSHLPLSTWIKAFHMMISSKKGVSALQLQRNLGLGSYKTAWHLGHRIRLAMKCEPMAGLLKGTVQADETYVGGKFRVGTGEDRKSQYENKTAVVALVETGGRVRSKPVANVNSQSLRAALVESCDPSARIFTDEHVAYPTATAIFEGGHATVCHSKEEYARKEFNNKTGKMETVTTNEVESYFSLLKRGVYGTFHHVSKQHLHRYCDEFDFRWDHRKTKDAARRDQALKQVKGKRLMFKSPIGHKPN